MSLLRRSAQSLVKSAASAVDRVSPPPPGVVVLAYHRVGGGSTLELDLEPELFDDQMGHLAESGRVVTLERALEDLTGDSGDDSVVVTFDDGTADFVDHALPSLVEHGVPATYYVATDFIERQRPFPDDGTPLTWSALAEAVSTGLVQVGSHTHRHAVVDKLAPEAVEEELRRCSELIEDRLGVTAADFAYPKGVFGGEANERVIARYHRSAALANCRSNPYGASNALRLDRTPIQRSDGMRFFTRKVSGGLRFEGALRGALNRRRYGASTN
jgi:peptidoglycan/xylan/chitin deacetylase (PgdA/CDA1 family)